jgi:hypothetical protein
MVTMTGSECPSFVHCPDAVAQPVGARGGVDPFIAQIACVSTSHRTQEAKSVSVPTHALKRTLGDRLVLEGKADWCDLRLVTPLHIAIPAAER